MKLQLFLSHNGVCSRRRALELIQLGKVKVNGQVVSEPSAQVDPEKDRILFEGKPITEKKYEYIMLNKPQGYVTTKSDPHAEKTVYDLLPENLHHLSPVGRLDKDTEGLLLLTNDGDLAYKLTHPKFNVDKTYFARVRGILKDELRKKIEVGIVIDGKKTAPAKFAEIKPNKDQTEFKLTIHEGQKRQIRVMLGQVGYPVLYLKRLEQGSLKLNDLPLGKWRHLDQPEVNSLKKVI